MKADLPFLRLVAYAYAGATALAYYFSSVYASVEVLHSIVAAWVMSLANLLLGYVSIQFGFDKSLTMFLKVVLGGTVLRLFLMWGAFLVMIKVYNFHQASLVFALLFLYMLNLVLEIYFLQKKVSIKSQS